MSRKEDYPVDVTKTDLLPLKPEGIYVAEKINKALSKPNVFFYPACGFDWEPIKQFSDRCSTFIYCDWHFSFEQFDFANGIYSQPIISHPINDTLWRDRLFPIDPQTLIRPLGLVQSGLLTQTEQASYHHHYNQFAKQPPWGRIGGVTHIINGEKRTIDLLYLSAEGVTTYLELFAARHRAPKYLCFKNCGAGFGFNWTDFRNYTAPLGRIVNANDPKPEYLAYERGDWPWKVAAEKGVFRR